MNLLSSILNNFPAITLTIVLVAFGTVVFIRLRRISQGIQQLTKLLKKNPIISRSELPEIISNNTSLNQLATNVLNTVGEAELEKSLSNGKQKIQSILLDQVTDALIVVDDMLEIRYANAASHTLLSCETNLIGRQLIEVSLDHRFTTTVEQALKLSEGSIQEYVGTSKSRQNFLIQSGPVDPSYQIGTGAWLMIRDVSIEKQTERIRKDFVANASHELRTPLSIIRGYLEMLEDDKQHAHAVGIMTKHTDRLTRIVEHMLLISRIESTDGGELQKNAPFDIGDCVYDTIDQLSPMIEDQNAIIDIKLPQSSDREFRGDRFYWDQIFFNLIENALKQNPNTKLRIEIVIEVDASTKVFLINIVDNGIGIPAGDLEKVFKRFYRVDKSHSQTIKGTGLGLSIVKRAIEAHNGTIKVTSRPHHKTCFSISVPRSR